MIRKLLFTSLLVTSNLLAYSRFTPENLVVIRVGNTISTTHVSLLELDPVVTSTSTLNMDALTLGGVFNDSSVFYFGNSKHKIHSS